MACVLKISRGGQIYRVGLEGQPDFEAVDAAVSRVLPGCGAADATFGGDGEAHPVTPEALEAFLAAGRELASGQVLLRLEVPELRAAPPAPARRRPAARAARARPAEPRQQGARRAEEDPRPLDELVAGLQEAPKKSPKKRSKKGARESAPPPGGPGAAGCPAPALGERGSDAGRGESAGLAASPAGALEEGSPDEGAVDLGPPPLQEPHRPCLGALEEDLDEGPSPALPKRRQRSSSCPARAIAPPAAGIAAPPDLPPEPSEVWPPTPESTPRHSPRFGYQMGAHMAADVVAHQQFAWVPVLVPVF